MEHTPEFKKMCSLLIDPLEHKMEVQEEAYSILVDENIDQENMEVSELFELGEDGTLKKVKYLNASVSDLG